MSLNLQLIEDEINRDPPRNIEAEAALLGALFFDNNAIPIVAQILQKDDFYEPVHGRMFNVMCKLHDKGSEVSPILMAPMFANDPGLKGVGAVRYMVELTSSSTLIIGYYDFAIQIRELAQKRAAILAFMNGVAGISDTGEDAPDIEDIADTVETQITALTARGAKEASRGVGGSAAKVRERYERLKENPDAVGARNLTLPLIEEIIGKLEPGTFNILAGRPGQAKTTVAVSLAFGYAAAGTPVEFFHLEMNDEQMDMRITADLSEMIGEPISHSQIKKGNLGSAELRTLEKIEAISSSLPISFTKLDAGTDVKRIDRMVGRARRKWAKKGYKHIIVFVDYLQIVGASFNGKTIEEPHRCVEAVSTAFNVMKDKHECSIFALCQLSRAVDERADKRPVMSDIKQAGKIEQDADSITFTYRPEYYLEQKKPSDELGKNYEEWNVEWQACRDKIDLIGGKNRHGGTTTRRVQFIKDNYAVRPTHRKADLDGSLIQNDLFNVGDSYPEF